jgi:hypothetical protein
MLRNRWMLMMVVLAMVVGFVGCATSTHGAAGTPEETVMAFYDWYNTIEGSPLGAGAYRECEYLDASMVDSVDALVASFDSRGGGYDPFVCAQDAPPEFTVLEVEGTPEQARVTVQAWSPIVVDLKLVDWAWKITEIHCTPPQN